MWKWILAIISLLVAITVAVAIFDIAGVVNVDFDTKQAVSGSLIRIPFLEPYLKTYRLGQKASKELSDREAELARERAELDKLKTELMSKEEELKYRQSQLEMQTQKLEADRRQAEAGGSNSAAETKRARQAKLYGEMQPKDAAKILSTQPDSEVASLLALLPDRRVAEIMPYFQADRAGRILALMGRPQ